MNILVHFEMKNNQLEYSESEALELSDFKAMDYFAVENYNLPIELMMENAGLQLANLVAQTVDSSNVIKIGIGNGNNGGGGLVAARRLQAWGYTVYLDIATEISKDLPKTQLKRALNFGASMARPYKTDVWVDAYLGFSQRLPLSKEYLSRCENANQSDAHRISLDIPTGFEGDIGAVYFESHKILTLAAPKKVLYKLPKTTEIYVADIGIPAEVYNKFKLHPLPFQANNILKLKR